jgi:acyl-CoA thioesterase
VADARGAAPSAGAAGSQEPDGNSHGAEPPASGDSGAFDRDTAVSRVAGDDREATGVRTVDFTAEVSPDWRAGRGPHGGYLAAMLLRALIETVADPNRAPRSLTIHYARAPQPAPVSIRVVVEREGRSLSTLSARMEQDGALVALALAAFSVPWASEEISELPMPDVAPADPDRESGRLLFKGAPAFTRHLVLQPRIGAAPFTESDLPMEIGGWLGLAEERPIDALSLAFFSDALFSPPYIRLREPATTPTIDLTIHFRTPMPRPAHTDDDATDADRSETLRRELCFARFRSGLVHEGFFEEDGVIWGADGAVLAQSRQLGIVMALPSH